MRIQEQQKRARARRNIKMYRNKIERPIWIICTGQSSPILLGEELRKGKNDKVD